MSITEDGTQDKRVINPDAPNTTVLGVTTKIFKAKKRKKKKLYTEVCNKMNNHVLIFPSKWLYRRHRIDVHSIE